MKTTWKPLLQDHDLLKAKEILHDIVQNLEQKNYEEPGSSLFTGNAGQALLYAYLFTTTQQEQHLDYATDLISECFDDIGGQEMIYTLCSGFTGISWAFNHLVSKGFIDADVNLVLEEIDGYSAMAALKDMEHNHIDFMHGGLGTGLYLTDRLPDNSSPQVLKKMVNLLDKSAEIDSDGIKWVNEAMRIMAPGSQIREYSLGLSHGIPSVIAFLSRVYLLGIEQEKCKALLEGSVNWLLRQELPADSISRFPGTVGEGIEPQGTRLAWCYGDLGIALVLWQAGEAIGREDWKQKAIELLLHATKRTDLQQHLAIDAGLCHGAAGIAHIFNRFYQATGIEALREAAVFWFRETFMHQRFEDGLAGFKTYNPIIKHWHKDAGLLEGVSGIGLALLAAMSDVEPEWDRCMFIS